MTRKKHGNSEKADYLQIGGSNINIYSKNKGLCLGAGILTIGGVTKIFVINLGGRDFFSSGIGGVVKNFVHHMKCNQPPQLVINDSSLNPIFKVLLYW